MSESLLAAITAIHRLESYKQQKFVSHRNSQLLDPHSCPSLKKIHLSALLVAEESLLFPTLVHLLVCG